jgi:UDP-N-acetylmuramyl pentapeptide phosphotransferase/UDP-N-acetylglucosamine-1-phosphate transferase
LYLALVFVTSFFLVVITTPSLIKVAILKRLLDEPDDERKLHGRRIPTIGGIIIFAATFFSFALWFPTESFFKTENIGNNITDLKYLAEVGLATDSMNDFKYILATVLILFFVGVKDDIVGTAAIKKLAAHILVAMTLVLMANVRITSMHGLFGVLQMPEWLSIFLSVFTIIVIVNAFNLIDGVDGLAAGIGLIASISFGIWFYLAGDNVLSLLAFSLGGSLFAFLFFNFNPAKIFMGDSGSLTIGLIVAILAIRLIDYHRLDQSTSQVVDQMSRPLFAMTVLVYPLIDTLRIFIYRIVRGISPFSADRNHIHHKLMDLGLGHRATVLVLYAFNLIIIGVCLLTRNIEASFAFLIIALVSVSLAQIPFLIRRKKIIYSQEELKSAQSAKSQLAEENLN